MGMKLFTNQIKCVRGAIRCAAIILQDMPLHGVPEEFQRRSEDLAGLLYDIDDKLLKFQRDCNRIKQKEQREE